MSAVLPILPAWTHALLIASRNHCLPEMIVLAAIANARNSIYLCPRSHQQAAHLTRQQFSHPLSDHIGQLNAFYAFNAFCSTVAEDDVFTVDKVCYTFLLSS